MILRILDIVASVMIVASLWNVTKNRKWWLVYAIGTVPFLYVTVSKGLIGLTIMGVVLLCTGMKNYFREGKKLKELKNDQIH